MKRCWMSWRKRSERNAKSWASGGSHDSTVSRQAGMPVPSFLLSNSFGARSGSATSHAGRASHSGTDPTGLVGSPSVLDAYVPGRIGGSQRCWSLHPKLFVAGAENCGKRRNRLVVFELIDVNRSCLGGFGQARTACDGSLDAVSAPLPARRPEGGPSRGALARLDDRRASCPVRNGWNNSSKSSYLAPGDARAFRGPTGRRLATRTRPL